MSSRRLTALAIVSLPFTAFNFLMTFNLIYVPTNTIEAGLSSFVPKEPPLKPPSPPPPTKTPSPTPQPHSPPSPSPPPSQIRLVIVRAIGNALPPRHSPEQTLDNLDFTLKYEVLPSEVKRHWYLNKLVDSDVEKKVIGRLKAANETYTVVPFDLKAHDRIPLAFEYLEPRERDVIHSRGFQENSVQQQQIEHIIQHNRVVDTLNVNGVRNDMIRYGKEKTNADYIAPFDGNCFLSKAGLEALLSSIQNHTKAKYFISQTDRLTGANEDLLHDSHAPNAVDEPQIIFHRNSTAEFNPKLRYGRRNKVELLNRLNAPGHWQAFKHWDKWERKLLGPQKIADIGEGVPTAGWVYRLQSGNLKAEQPDQRSMRSKLRIKAVPQLMDKLDLRAARELHNFSSSSFVFFNATQLELERQQWKHNESIAPINELLKLTNSSLTHGPWSVMDKEACGSSGDCRNYFSQALNDTEAIDEKQSDFYRLASMQRNTTILALAYSFTGDTKYATKAADNINHWFINPKTRMNPTLKYAQVDPKNKKGDGTEYGLFEMKDLYFFLDAVRMVEASGALSPKDQKVVQKWFTDYLTWLLQSKQGKAAYITPNLHGLYYDIQVIAVAAYANDLYIALRTMHRAVARLETHYRNNLSKKASCGDRMLTLEGWAILARMTSKIGVNIWDRFHKKKKSSLCHAMELANTYPCRRQPVDPERWLPLWHDTKLYCPALKSVESKWWKLPKNAHEIRSMYPPSDGIAPFWNLGR